MEWLDCLDDTEILNEYLGTHEQSEFITGWCDTFRKTYPVDAANLVPKPMRAFQYIMWLAQTEEYRLLEEWDWHDRSEEAITGAKIKTQQYTKWCERFRERYGEPTQLLELWNQDFDWRYRIMKRRENARDDGIRLPLREFMRMAKIEREWMDMNREDDVEANVENDQK